MVKGLWADFRTFLWSLCGSAVFAGLVTWYQGVIKTQEAAHLRLDPFRAVFAALPPLAAFAIFLALGLLVASALAVLHGFWTHWSRPRIAGPRTGTAPATDDDLRYALTRSNEALQAAVTARDDALLELNALNLQQPGDWETYEIPTPLNATGPTAITINPDTPGRQFPLRHGDFQVVKWAQGEIQTRIDHLGLVRRGDQYAVKLKIVVQTESGKELNLATGAEVRRVAAPEFILLASATELAPYSTGVGAIEYVGNPRAHYPDFAASTVCVRQINSKTGEVQIEAFFGGKLQ